MVHSVVVGRVVVVVVVCMDAEIFEEMMSLVFSLTSERITELVVVS